jgi:malonate-semialdehyde dehydrogenase (acetylating)/methylmalonate-semialdehyde dehydrogenase
MSVSAESVRTLSNYVNGNTVSPETTRRLPVFAPGTGKVIAEAPMSTAADLDDAVSSAVVAQKEWGGRTVKDRVQVLFRMKALLESQIDELAKIITLENGKTLDESKASITRAIECVEFATSLPQISPGQVLEVSRGIECKLVRSPLGVVAGITPFNFPLMVPLWMAPMAIGLGNAFILKPSEQTPLSAIELGRLFKESGLPDGLFSVVHGDREAVEAICDHPQIRAVGFVGSSRVSRLVYTRGTAAGKKVRAMGGAKNHLIVVPDAEPEMTASNVVASVVGCAGQRCMAASVMVSVGDVDHIVEKIHEKMGRVVAGRDIGAVISSRSRDRITGYLERAKEKGAKLTLDGRKLVADDVPADGYYLGPSIIDHASPEHEASCDEIFGPTLTIIRCRTLDEALEIENNNPYGNAASIYTSTGRVAQHFSENASAGMLGINIGVPVPREPFPFGGWNTSAFGDGDITGIGAIDFWTRAKKITTKWSDEFRKDWNS